MLNVLKIGNVKLPGNLVLSPMAGVTDAPFREIARQNGADYCISEMLTSQTNLWHTNKSKSRLQDTWENTPKIIQIAGATPDVVVDAAIKCEEIGAKLIEINMGCPAKKVCNVLAGSALLKDETLVSDILNNVSRAVTIPVILKTRLGWDHNNLNILTIAKIAEDAGISGITIHGRTRCDLYNGNATYDLIASVKQNVSIPVFANGDITTPELAKHVLEYTQVDGLYIGRGALGKPWLFSQIKEYLSTGSYPKSVGLRHIKTTMLKHMGYIYEHYGEAHGCKIARKHVKWYWQNLIKDTALLQGMFADFSMLEKSELQRKFILEDFSPHLNI